MLLFAEDMITPMQAAITIKQSNVIIIFVFLAFIFCSFQQLNINTSNAHGIYT